MKKIEGVYFNESQHWVGDGFPVRTVFSYNRHASAISPFLMLDHAGPAQFEPAQQPRGVGEHPHRGFETVTIVYQGEVDHRDSTGAGGHIGPGDVQWMTAAAGLMHEEMHSQAFSERGGMMEMAQLWVNLPAKDKMSQPRYQTILDSDIPRIELANGAGSARVIAGEFEGRHGPAKTFTPMQVLDVHLTQGQRHEFAVPDGYNTLVVLLDGAIRINDEVEPPTSSVVILSNRGSGIDIAAQKDSKLLILAGEPIDEPIAGYGPFVMNTREEIERAVRDYQSGLFGQIPAIME